MEKQAKEILNRIKKINKRTEQLQLTKNYKSDDDILKRTIIILCS